MRHTVLPVVLFSALLFSACHRRAFPPPEGVSEAPPVSVVPETSPKDDAPWLVASFARTVCFGSCPAYEVWIYSDGQVIWCGEANVGRIGTYRSKAPDAWLKDLVRAADEAGFWSMYTRYPIGGKTLEDVPYTVSYLHQGKKERRIVNNADAPPALLRLEKYWEEKLEELEWEAEEWRG